MLAKTPVIQCTPCYFAVSALLMNPSPDRSNYSPYLPHPLPHSGRIMQYFSSLFRPDPLPSRSAGDYHCCSALLQNLVGNSGETQCLDKVEQQAEAVSMFLILLFILLTQYPFVSFLSLSSLCSLSQSSLFSLSTIPSFSSDQIFCPPKIKILSFITFCFQ